MYGQLGRMDVFRNEYCKSKAAAAHKRWFAFATSGPGGRVGGTTGSGLATWLPSFLEYLQVCLWVVYCPVIFGCMLLGSIIVLKPLFNLYLPF